MNTLVKKQFLPGDFIYYFDIVEGEVLLLRDKIVEKTFSLKENSQVIEVFYGLKNGHRLLETRVYESPEEALIDYFKKLGK